MRLRQEAKRIRAKTSPKDELLRRARKIIWMLSYDPEEVVQEQEQLIKDICQGIKMGNAWLEDYKQIMGEDA